jgi:hypothetical protein
MNYPTGMGPATGMHYFDVAARMQAHLHNHGHGGQHLHFAHGHFQQNQPSFAPVFASQGFANAFHHAGFNPDDQFGAAGRNLMRHLFS